MNLLEYGMKNRRHSSAIRRILAKAALFIAEKEADVMEWRINRKQIELPETGDGDEMLERIRQEIAKQENINKQV